IYDTYICGNKIITIRENPQIPCLLNTQYKVKKSLARSSMCMLIKILLLLRPYNFVFGGVNKNSFIFNTIVSKGQLGSIQYDSKDTIKIKDFSWSSIRTGKCKSDNRLVPDNSILDALTRHTEARIEVNHNHYTEKEKKCSKYRQTYHLCGLP